MLHRPRHRQARRYRQQHVDMIAIDRARVNHHLVRPRRLAQQLPAPLAHVTTEHRMAILCDPHQMVLAVPDRVAAALVSFHAGILRRSTELPRPPKGVGFPDPLSGTLNARIAHLTSIHNILDNRIFYRESLSEKLPSNLNWLRAA